MVKNPLPWAPSKAHPEHRQKRLELEREHPAFNNKDGYYKAGLLALMAGIALFPWEKKHQEHDDKIRKEERQNQDDRRRRSYDDRGRDDHRRDDRRRSVDDRQRGDYAYEDRRRRSRYADEHTYYDDKRDRRHSSVYGGSDQGRSRRDARGQRSAPSAPRHANEVIY
ncbi:hypothetical protein BP5796_09101 [Coleophoma crateriformis]|uniref:Uncharacterized protein n=1 Tax=Coleophoma crateriformis TaxID=565419 RepID=A0A3D8R3Q3_9HELO|nr:hypothetical protein BP5796_09101 [Coleophoma crateriformis]